MADVATVTQSKSRTSLTNYQGNDGKMSFVAQFRHSIINPESGIPQPSLTLQASVNGIPGEKAGISTVIPAGNEQMRNLARQKMVVAAAQAGLKPDELVEQEPFLVQQNGLNFWRLAWLKPAAEVHRV